MFRSKSKSRNSKRNFRLQLTSLTAAGCCLASVTSAQSNGLRFDFQYNLIDVQALAFDTQNNELFAASDGSLKRWSLDPLMPLQSIKIDKITTETDEIPIDMIVSDLAVSPKGLVYASGQQWNPDQFRLLGGQVLGFRKDEGGDFNPFIVYSPGDFNQAASGRNVPVTAQYTSAAFDQVWSYFASPVDFAVLVHQDIFFDHKLDGPIISPAMKLKCGPSSKLSVVNTDNKDVYISSTTNGALIEVGDLSEALDNPDKYQPECFRAADVFGTAPPPSNFNPVLHEVIEVTGDKGAQTFVLALETNTNRLHLFELAPTGDGYRLLRRNDPALDLSKLVEDPTGPQEHNMLSASSDGSLIFVGGRSMTQVLRFAVQQGNLVENGTLDVHRPLQLFEVSADGRHAAIAVGESFQGGDVFLQVISSPKEMPRTAAVPKKNEDVMAIQARLSEAGFNSLRVDGFVGPNTFSTIDAFFQTKIDDLKISDEASKQELEEMILRLFPTSGVQKQVWKN